MKVNRGENQTLCYWCRGLLPRMRLISAGLSPFPQPRFTVPVSRIRRIPCRPKHALWSRHRLQFIGKHAEKPVSWSNGRRCDLAINRLFCHKVYYNSVIAGIQRKGGHSSSSSEQNSFNISRLMGITQRHIGTYAIQYMSFKIHPMPSRLLPRVENHHVCCSTSQTPFLTTLSLIYSPRARQQVGVSAARVLQRCRRTSSWPHSSCSSSALPGTSSLPQPSP